MKRGAPLKRSGFARRNAPERRTPVAKAVPGVFRLPAAVATQALAIHKSAPVRSEAYRRAVAQLPCVICGIYGYSQAAHANTGKGMGMKACDLTLFPACADRIGMRGCHSKLDQGALFAKYVRRELEEAWAADTQRRVRLAGLWPKSLPYPPAALDS